MDTASQGFDPWRFGLGRLGCCTLGAVWTLRLRCLVLGVLGPCGPWCGALGAGRTLRLRTLVLGVFGPSGRGADIHGTT